MAGPSSMAASVNPLAHKIQNILKLNLEDPTLLEALYTLDPLIPVNGTEARRNLPGLVEKSVLHHCDLFCTTCGDVEAALSLYQGQLDEFAEKTDAFEHQIAQLVQETRVFLDATNGIYKKRDELMAQRDKMDGFLTRFTLSEKTIDILTSPSSPIDQAFFEALIQVEQMNEDSATLLSLYTGEGEDAAAELTTSALIAAVQHYQERGYEKLCRWTQMKCRALVQDNSEISSNLRQAITLLQHRPVFLHVCLQELEQARRTTNARAFLDALTRGGPHGFPRPIEINAHDYLRYVGDMLAWVHQTCVTEREVLESLFGLKHNRNLQKSPEIPSASSWADELLPNETVLLETLDKSMESVCRPLQVRIDQVLTSVHDPVLCMQIQHLLSFYLTTLTTILLPGANLSKFLGQEIRACDKRVMETLNVEAGRLLQGFDARQLQKRELIPPPQIKTAIARMAQIAKLLPASMRSVDATDVAYTVTDESLTGKSDAQQLSMGKIIPFILDPLLRGIAAACSSLSPLEASIFEVNCLEMMLAGEYFREICPSAPQIEALKTHLDAAVDVLVLEQYQSILHHAGVEKIISAISTNTSSGTEESDLPKTIVPLATISGLEGPAIAIRLSNLDVFLCSVTIDISASLQRITSTRIARRVAHQGFHRFLDAYQKLYAAIMDPYHGYAKTQQALLRTPEQVSLLLLSVEDEEEELKVLDENAPLT